MTLNGCRLGFYEPMRNTLTKTLYKDPSRQSLGVNIFCGATSGMLGAAAGSPFFLIKTRLQSYSKFLPVGTQHQYRGAMDGLRHVYSNEGLKGLYRGVGAAMVRTGFGSSVQLPTYFFAKRRLVRHLGMEEGTLLHLASSTASGFVVCCVMHPPGILSDEIHSPAHTDRLNDRHNHVADVQPNRKSVQRGIRLLVQNSQNGRILCHLQRLCGPSSPDSASHGERQRELSSCRAQLTLSTGLNIDAGGANEQADAKARGPSAAYLEGKSPIEEMPLR